MVLSFYCTENINLNDLLIFDDQTQAMLKHELQMANICLNTMNIDENDFENSTTDLVSTEIVLQTLTLRYIK